ncbi:MAG: hypothetical protein JWP87_4590 [Labilithrix sp.]|nr:hypothetical protein [Labilithrix sp.]
MTTLLYGDKPGSDVEPGNRVDSSTDPSDSPPPPSSVRPTYPTPTPWHHRQPLAFRAIMIGLAAVAAVLVGLSMFSIALVWSNAMTQLAQVALMVAGGYLIAAGIAYVASAKPETA